jgi:hypothetical protein
MGQFSWCCALCDQEIMHGTQPGYQWTTDAVILWPNGDRRSGRYEEGYGRVAGINLVEQMGGWRIVHQRCYVKLDLRLSAPAMFAGFKPERHASDQGWWPGERKAIIRYGQPEHSELTKEKTYVCYECKRTWKSTWSGGLCPFGCVRPKNYRDSERTIAEGWGDHNELAEPFRHISYDLGTADGVIICRNENEERPDWKAFHAFPREDRPEEPPTKIEPCFYFGKPEQARVTKPRDWDWAEPREDSEPFVVRCRGCKTDNVEIVKLTEGVPNE